MCYNKTTSLGAFIFGMIFTGLLISKKKYNYALFNCAIVFMQLFEYFGHISLDENNSKLNTIISGLILTLVFLQPLIYIYAFRIKSYKFNEINLLTMSILLFVCIYLLFIYNLIKSNTLSISYFKPGCTNYCRMNWKFFGEKLYLSIPFFIMYFYLFIYFMPKTTTSYYNNLFAYTLALSILYMIFVDRFKGLINYYSAFGSIWCIFSVIYGPLSYFYG